jgi:hypothetical protein
VALPASTSTPTSGACARRRGKAARICRDLVGAGLTRLAAQQRVGAVEYAISTATNRLSTATVAGNASGVALQSAALAALNGELAAALGAKNNADAALARQLRRHHIRVLIAPAALAKTNRLIERRTAAGGVTAARFRAFLAAQLSAQPLDYSHALLQRVPTAFSTEIAHTITLPGITTLYDALVAQHAIPSERLARLGGDLRSASTTNGAARRATLKQFVRDAAGTAGEAGALLIFAATPLA